MASVVAQRQGKRRRDIYVRLYLNQVKEENLKSLAQEYGSGYPVSGSSLLTELRDLLVREGLPSESLDIWEGTEPSSLTPEGWQDRVRQATLLHFEEQAAARDFLRRLIRHVGLFDEPGIMKYSLPLPKTRTREGKVRKRNRSVRPKGSFATPRPPPEGKGRYTYWNPLLNPEEGVPGDFPQVAVRIGKVPGIPSPKCVLGRFDQGGSGRYGHVQ